MWRLTDGIPYGDPLTGHDNAATAVAVGALPDGTPIAVSGGRDGTVRVWRLTDGSPYGDPLTGHDGGVEAVAVGALPDGTPIAVSGGVDGTVRVWRLTNGPSAGPSLRLQGSIWSLAYSAAGVVTAVAQDLALHSLGAAPTPIAISMSATSTAIPPRLAGR